MNMLPGFERQSGYRLSKLEVYNWGTFDSAVHGFHPRGEWTLLVGENGTGKSTIVDALLTLLVRPNTRKYNFASGAAKTERDEKTYIQGAYDKTIGTNGTPQLKYLRPGNKHYSALLAAFENLESGKVFTVCQILHLDSNNKRKSYYAFDDMRERGIAEDLGNITEGSSILSTLKSRDFKATESYTQYFDWLRRKTGCRPKAMDMFNQAAWVKDVNRLDSFVREQMLEKKPWDEKVAQLLKHFSELSETYRALVTVREQARMLEPIKETGQQYDDAFTKLQTAKEQLEATSLYFSFAKKRLLEPMCREWDQRLQLLTGEINQIEENIHRSNRDVARIEVEISGAGGERMQRIPDMITLEQERYDTRHQARIRFEQQLQQAEVEANVDSVEALSKLLKFVLTKHAEVEQSRTEVQQKLNSLQYELGQLKQRIRDDRDELESLEKRKGNMPRELVLMRDEICRELNIPSKDLPFAAELMTVDSNHREWEASIEQVLSSFARDLLVKERHYAKVSGFIDHKCLTDGAGRGLRLTYTRVGSPKVSKSSPTQSSTIGQSLFSMLKFREENGLAPWVRGQVAERFDFLACETIKQFQTAQGPAMTKNRHIKRNRFNHIKDDRNQSSDRRRFILGWENREKILALKAAIESGAEELQQFQRQETALLTEIEQFSNVLRCLEQISELKDFSEIDDVQHRENMNQLKMELERLKKSNDKIRELEGKKSELEREIQHKQEQQKLLFDERSKINRNLEDARKFIDSSSRDIDKAKSNGSYDRLSEQFEAIDELLTKTPLTIDNIPSLPTQFNQKCYNVVQRLEKRLLPIQKSLTSQMGKFLGKYPAFQSEMDYNVDSLPQFLALQIQIEKEDLPRHVDRFKERLNENVLTEIGVMNSHLENEREEIIQKIEEINEGLQRMQWREGTHIRLDPEESQNPEIRDFRRELAGCLTGYLDGTNQANEETFLRIQKLVDKLSDDKNVRWREKVIDVRNWFNFSAQELVTETGEPRSYYDGGSGKSGGEKARLAFLVLVAAIVYQYDIDPDDDNSDQFHFVMVDEMFSRTASKYAHFALDLFKQFGLQLLVVAPLDAKARVCESYVGLHAHVVKDPDTDRSEILSYSSEQLQQDLAMSNK